MGSSEIQLGAAIRQNNPTLTHQLLLERIDSPDFPGGLLLKLAINCHNVEIVCMLLYYYPYLDEDVWDYFTPFSFSLIYGTKEIQEVLLDYEDFHGDQNDRVLYMAVAERSSLVLNILERGVNVAVYNENCPTGNIVVQAMLRDNDTEVVKALWRRYDYESWRRMFAFPLLHYLLKFFESLHYYLSVILEYENNLVPLIGHFQEFCSTSIITELYLFKTQYPHIFHDGVSEDQSLLMLSYGARIYGSDLDIIYHYGFSKNFMTSLLYQDLEAPQISRISPMFFKYLLVADIETFLQFAYTILRRSYDGEDLVKSMATLRCYYTFRNINRRYLRRLYRRLTSLRICYTTRLRKILRHTRQFPSLKQLARDASRLAIIRSQNVNNICQFYTWIDNVALPNFVKGILKLDIPIYVPSYFKFTCGCRN